MRIDRKYEGKCIAIVRGKIVASGIDIKKVAAESRARYPHDEITLTNVIKGDRVFIF
ncbi:succinyl-CoA synthetase subunit alpha [Candidatus Woesearchaeota archaeon]|nr:succinyl-CoA synthetase subunit alpha [Candidatus Woesearchaeota archaeon]